MTADLLSMCTFYLCGMYGGRRDVYRILVGRPEGKRPFGRSRCKWEDNIKWIFRKWDGKAWTGLL